MSIGRFGVVLLALCFAAACAAGSAPAEDQDVTVFAAASLTRPFTEAAPGLAPLRVRYSFAGSQALVTQIQQGAPADVVATADTATMTALSLADLVEPPAVFATTSLVIAVAAGNPKRIGGLADLARPDVTVVLADPTVPVGAYALQALATAGVEVKPKSRELDTKATLGRVESGDADAAIVYATDVRTSTKAEAVEIPEAKTIAATYVIAVVKATRHRAAAEAFVASVRAGKVREALGRAGFG